jgi:hypothetical protein
MTDEEREEFARQIVGAAKPDSDSPDPPSGEPGDALG